MADPRSDLVPGTEDGEAPRGTRGLDLSILRQADVRILVASRTATKLGLATLSYGGMVFLARSGAPQWQVSVVGAVGFVSALTFGLQGGLVADSLPKRLALVVGYAAQAALCFLVPTLFGVGLASLLILTFAVSMLAQITTPAGKAAIAVVASAGALASMAVLVNVAGGLGSAFGSAFLAPLLIKLTDIRTLMYVSGAILAFGAIRAARLPQSADDPSLREALRQVDWRPQLPTPRQAAGWIAERPAIASMVLVGAVVVALFESLNTLLPVYVREVLDTDPANSVYIFAPAGLGYLIGMVGGPRLMHRLGERTLLIVALGFIAGGSALFGFVDQLAPILAPISPMRLLGIFGVELSDPVLAAGMISLPTNFGSTAAASAALTYINRRVPVESQGATFGMQEVFENGLTVVSLLILGVIASWLGSRVVFVVAPLVIGALVVWFVLFSYRVTGSGAPTGRAVVRGLLATAEPVDAARTRSDHLL